MFRVKTMPLGAGGAMPSPGAGPDQGGCPNGVRASQYWTSFPGVLPADERPPFRTPGGNRMGLQYTVSSEQEMLLVSASGDVRRGDMDDLRARLLADVRIVPGTRMLFDTRGAISHLSFSDLKDIANRLKGI